MLKYVPIMFFIFITTSAKADQAAATLKSFEISLSGHQAEELYNWLSDSAPIVDQNNQCKLVQLNGVACWERSIRVVGQETLVEYGCSFLLDHEGKVVDQMLKYSCLPTAGMGVSN